MQALLILAVCSGADALSTRSSVSRRSVQRLLGAAAGALALPRKEVWAAERTAVFAGGDPRCLQPAFDELAYRGVRRVEVGRVAEVRAVRVTFDDAKCSYKQLLGAYWRNTRPVAQFEPGPEFRSVVWARDDAERRAAEASRDSMHKSGVYGRGAFVTEVQVVGGGGDGDFVATPDEGQDFAKKDPKAWSKLMAQSGREKFFADAYKPIKTTACEGTVCGYVIFPCSQENGCQDVVSGTW